MAVSQRVDTGSGVVGDLLYCPPQVEHGDPWEYARVGLSWYGGPKLPGPTQLKVTIILSKPS